MMKQIQVDLGERSYPIYIGQNLMNDSEALSRYLFKKRILIVTNETVAPLYLNQIQEVMVSLVRLRASFFLMASNSKT